MFPLNDVYLRCSLFIILCATTFAAPGGLGSFAGSSSAAFSSASASAQAGSVAGSISSANAFTGGSVSSNNPDGMSHGLTHHPSISAGSGSYVGLGSNNPNSDKFGLSHQMSGNTGNYNDKSRTPCSQCQNIYDKWEKDDYDKQYEEKEESKEEQELDDCPDDGQYRPEHYHHKDDNKKQGQQTVTGVQKIAGSNQYNYDQASVKGGQAGVDNTKQEKINNESFGHYGNTGTVGNIEATYPSGNSNIDTSKDSLHSTPSWTDNNKNKENAGISVGGVAPNLSWNNNGGTSTGTSGAVTPGKTNVGLTSDTNVGCSSTGSASNCGTTGTDSSQGPVKIGQADIQAPIVPALKIEGNGGTIGCSNNFYGKCGNTKPHETGQYPSTSGNVDVGNKPHLPDQQSTGQWPGVGNKPSLFDQQNTGKWQGHVNTGSSLSVHTGNIGAGNKPHLPDQQSTGQWPGVGNKPSSVDQQNTGKWQGHVNTGSSLSGHTENIGAGNKPHLPDQQSTGQWPGVGNKPSLFDQQNTGKWQGHANTGSSLSGHTENIGAGNKPHLPDQQSTGQWPGVGNKPSSFDQQNTGQWQGHANTGSSLSGHAGIIGAGNKPHLPDQQSTGQWPGVGNKPSSFDQQNTGKWQGHANTGSSLSGHTGNIGAGNKPHLPDQQSTPCSSGVSPLQKILPISSQTYAGVGAGTSYTDNKNTAAQGTTHGTSTGHGDDYYPGGQKDFHSPIGGSTPSTGQTGNIGTTFPHGSGVGGVPQNGIGIKQSGSPGNCGTFGGSTCTSNAGYPGRPQIKFSGTGTPGIGAGQNVQGQTHTGNVDAGQVDKNTYQFNLKNPFLYDGQGNINPLIHTTSSPVQIPSHTGTIETTSKPIDLGNPFLDGTLDTSTTDGTHSLNSDKINHNKGVISTGHTTLDKPIAVGNPFLTHKPHGHGGNEDDSPIYNLGITIGGISNISTSAEPPVTTTVKPIEIDNPFFKTPSVLPSGVQSDKNMVTGSGTTSPFNPFHSSPMDEDSTHFPKLGYTGVGNVPSMPSGPYSNVNQGVKGDAQHNKAMGGIANSNAGALATGNIDADKSIVPAILGTHNGYNNAGHAGSSLIGNVNANKSTNSFSNAPGSYDNKDTSQKSGSDGSIDAKGHSGSGSSINGNNVNNQYNPQVGNAGALSFAGANVGANAAGNAGAHAGSYAGSFSSSQASSASSSFAKSHSGSYTAHGDPSNILQQLKGNWPFDVTKNVDANNSWSSAASHAAAFASSNAGSWSGPRPVGVKS